MTAPVKEDEDETLKSAMSLHNQRIEEEDSEEEKLANAMSMSLKE